VGVPYDDEHPGLAVLGTRRMDGGPEAAFDQRLAHRLVVEPAGGALSEDDVEELRRGGRRAVSTDHFSACH
jgi:hypothetical protein